MKHEIDQRRGVSTLFGRIRKVGAEASIVALGVTGASMLAPQEKDTNQEALNQMKNRTPIEQVFSAVGDAVSIDKVKADVSRFSDIIGNPYEAAINHLAAQINSNTGENIINGYDDGTFKPEREVARQHFAKMIVNALELAVPEGNTVFKDVNETGSDTRYPDDFIRVAVENDIIMGYPDGTFKPFDNINRAQEVTMIVRALQKFAPGVLKTPPADYQSPFGAFDLTHQENMNIFYNNELNKGINWNTDPWKAMTRGETAQVLDNFLKLNEQSTGVEVGGVGVKIPVPSVISGDMVRELRDGGTYPLFTEGQWFHPVYDIGAETAANDFRGIGPWYPVAFANIDANAAQLTTHGNVGELVISTRNGGKVMIAVMQLDKHQHEGAWGTDPITGKFMQSDEWAMQYNFHSLQPLQEIFVVDPDTGAQLTWPDGSPVIYRANEQGIAAFAIPQTNGNDVRVGFVIDIPGQDNGVQPSEIKFERGPNDNPGKTGENPLPETVLKPMVSEK